MDIRFKQGFESTPTILHECDFKSAPISSSFPDSRARGLDERRAKSVSNGRSEERDGGTRGFLETTCQNPSQTGGGGKAMAERFR